MRELIAEYYATMQSIDPAFHWPNPEWWSDENYAKVIPAIGNQGFAIIGYGKNVDDDVASEICELYCKNPWHFMPLIRSCLPHIRWPFGFQVLEPNTFAQTTFERMMRLLKVRYIKYLAEDGESQVYKYRISNATSDQHGAYTDALTRASDF